MIKHFQRGASPTFHCTICGRRTRNTESSNDLCGQCYELAGWDNHHNDSGTVPTVAELASYERLVKQAAAKGGNAELIRQQFDYIWQL